MLGEPGPAEKKAHAAREAAWQGLQQEMDDELDQVLAGMRAAEQTPRTQRERIEAMALVFGDTSTTDLRRLLVTALCRLADPPPTLWQRIRNTTRSNRGN